MAWNVVGRKRDSTVLHIALNRDWLQHPVQQKKNENLIVTKWTTTMRHTETLPLAHVACEMTIPFEDVYVIYSRLALDCLLWFYLFAPFVRYV